MIRSFARLAHPIASGGFVACAIVQVFLAGLGVFDDPRAFITHREFGYAFGWLTLIVLILALVGRSPRRITGLSILLLVQFALQSVFVALRGSLPAIAALHPLNGFALLGVGIVLTRLAWQVRRADQTAPAGVPVGSLVTTRDAG
ncbi:MAG TPA: DUF6220 domain-containing protein [Candidatus Limnocylindrales bacterium]|jgi:hypothetical protein|nr:DUF6220 domain-containing protein [Candidatus Limnocylindrales bacterium]